MGTLTSCSFGTVSLKRGSSCPVSNAFSLWRKTTATTMKPKSLCFLCRKREEVSYRTVGRFRCSGSNDGDVVGEDGANSSSDSNVTATAVQPEEAAEERRSRNELGSEESPASVSSRQKGMGVDSGNDNYHMDFSELMLLPGPERVDPADVKLIKDKLFGYSTFWVRDEEPYGYFDEGTLFIGNLRGNREEVFAKLQRLLVEVTGDKYNLFMVEEPYAEELDPRGGPRVSFALLRKEASEPGPTTLWQYVIAFLLFILTAASSVKLGIASQMDRLPPEVVKYFTDPDTVDPPDMELLLPYVDSALPLAYSVLGILIFHEVGHLLAAYSKKVKLSIPFFIPNITLGSFGAITQFKSILPDRSTKVDISLAGPFAGAVLSSLMFAVGLLLSSNPDAVENLVQVPSVLFQDSLLLGLISRAALGYSAMHTATVSIHPLVIAGWCGLTMTALNLLPVGCLDGGRAMQGAFGRGALLVSSLITYSMLGFGLLGGSLSSRYWGLFVVVWQRGEEKPCFNDVAEVGKWRKGAVVMATLLVLLTLLPVWDELAEELGIGLVSTF